MKMTIKVLLLSAIVLSLSVSAFAGQDGSCDANVPMNDGISVFDNILPILGSEDGVLNDNAANSVAVADVQGTSSCWIIIAKRELHGNGKGVVPKGVPIQVTFPSKVSYPFANGAQVVKATLAEKFNYDGYVSNGDFNAYTCEEYYSH